LITGGARGIGFTTAQRFGREGALVAVNDIEADLCETAVTQLAQEGITAIPVAFDVSKSAEVDEGVSRVVAEFGALNVLVNNAGVVRMPPAARARAAQWAERKAAGDAWGSLQATVNTDDELWYFHMRVMADGVFFCIRAALREMERTGSGAIVNVASTGAYARAAELPYYGAAKAVVVSLTRSIGLEVAGAGIRVNAVSPGPVDTQIFRNNRVSLSNTSQPRQAAPAADASSAGSAGEVPLGRFARPDEIASAILFLASDEASFCCGEILPLTGGT
jgi:3-oxoacyl-[acyl-carrier protein] reductase